MGWDRWVLDASMGGRDGIFTFCPVEGDLTGEYTVITGMNFVSDRPPEGGSLVAIIHPDGQEAVEHFCQRYAVELAALR